MIFMGHGIEDATLTLDAGTVHASYALTNLNSRYKTKQFRTAAGSATTIQIEIDFTAARNCDTLIIGGTNFDTVDGLILETGSVDNGSTYDIENLLDQTCTAENNYFAFTADSKRYWRLTFTGFANNAADYIGLIFLGMRYTTPRDSENNINVGYEYGANEKMTRAGVITSYKEHGEIYKESGFSINGYTEAQKTTFFTYINDTEKMDGKNKPFFFLADDGSTWKYGRFSNPDLQFKKISYDYYGLSFSLIEQL